MPHPVSATVMRTCPLWYLTEHARRDRKVLLVITDGNDNASRISVDEIRRHAERRGIAIYTVGLLRNAGRRRELEELAEATGGAAYFTATSGDKLALEPIALEIARQIRSQYMIAFAPPSFGARRVVPKAARHREGVGSHRHHARGISCDRQPAIGVGAIKSVAVTYGLPPMWKSVSNDDASRSNGRDRDDFCPHDADCGIASIRAAARS